MKQDIFVLTMVSQDDVASEGYQNYVFTDITKARRKLRKLASGVFSENYCEHIYPFDCGMEYGNDDKTAVLKMLWNINGLSIETRGGNFIEIGINRFKV